MSLMNLAMLMACGLFAHVRGDEEIITCGSTIKLIHIDTVSAHAILLVF
jgi:hypothetical protein